MRTLLLIFILTLTFNAQCNTSSYLGAGSSGIVVSAEGFTAGGVGVNIYAGYRFSPTWSTEVAFNTSSPLEDGAATVKPQLLSMSAIGHFPLSQRFSLFARAGLHYWSTDIDVGQHTVIERDGTDPHLGLGFEFALTNKLMLRQDYLYAPLASDAAHQLNFSLNYQF